MTIRTLELKSLKPNPMRDFRIDPVDKDVVRNLTQSIKEDGFWGGVTARQNGKSGYQIAAGWHRVQAAISAGVREAPIFVSPDWTDADMIRIYAVENATQRGNTSSAMVGTVAAAVRFIAKALMTDTEVSQICDTNAQRAQALSALTSADGIGERVVSHFLARIPSVHETMVKQQLAALKASGDYARIIDEVRDEIEREHKEAIREMERAEKARIAAEEAAAKAEQERKEAAAKLKAAKEERDRQRAEAAKRQAEIEAHEAEQRRKKAEEDAKKFDQLRTTVTTARAASDKANDREPTFDLEGVASIFRNPAQLEAFRSIVTSKQVLPYLSVKRQAALAAQLVKQAKQQNVELTSAFIRQNVMSMVLGVEERQRKIGREEREQVQVHDWESKAKTYQHDFARQISAALAAAQDILRHDKARPAKATFYRLGEFKGALQKARELCRLIDKL